MKDASTVCEMLYKLRDAVLAGNTHIAIYLSREVHDKLLSIHQAKESIDCSLNCEIKGKE